MMYRYCSTCRTTIPANEYLSHRARHVLHVRQQRGQRTGSTTAWRRLRAQVIARDDGHCRYPGCIETTGLEVHHVNGNPRDDRPANLVTLCHDHHVQVTHEPT
jgi:5-methylcytosine-specific restriction endonuclease McrA